MHVNFMMGRVIKQLEFVRHKHQIYELSELIINDNERLNLGEE